MEKEIAVPVELCLDPANMSILGLERPASCFSGLDCQALEMQVQEEVA